ncbi:MAG: WYL domain-containing protein [Muribaculaceae bacterium]|nr:WYL domain-containing protein [Muribaculaceae bacterium]MDE6026935.1 WYL domain-containing protein [Muribaculaceae bacterium]
MARDIISRYIWLIDTLTRYKKLTRAEINDLWLRSSLSDGRLIPERTFFHYRRAIEENFHIDIRCNRAGEYYIERSEDPQDRLLTNYLLDSYAVNSAVKESLTDPSRVAVEDVPSAREFLPMVLDAIGHNEKIEFTYAGFNRSRHEKEIIFHPYFVKRYKQRWYMIGLKEAAGSIRTYALDRVKEMKILSKPFVMPEEITHASLFGNLIGVTSSQAPVRVVKLMTDTTQAKYFRALPFHASQSEEIHDAYSIFTFKLKLNYELVHEILSFGNSVKVLQPRELEVMVRNELETTLALYDTAGSIPGRK